jgi:hypothetical protein
MRVKWSGLPRAHRRATVGAFVGMGVGAIAVFQYAFYRSTFDRWLIMVAGLLGGGAVGLLLAKATTIWRNQTWSGHALLHRRRGDAGCFCLLCSAWLA